MFEYENKILKKACVGQKFWFWFSVGNPHAPIILEDLTGSNERTFFLERVNSRPVVPGSTQVMGVASIASTGVFQLASPLIADGMLEVLAEWAVRNQEEFPNLGVFCGAVMICLERSGGIKQVYSNPHLWQDLKKKYPWGMNQRSQESLAKLKKGHSAALFIVEDSGGIRTLAVPMKMPGANQMFASLVNLMERQSDGSSTSLTGLCRKSSNGSLILITENNIEKLNETITAWLTAANFHLLSHVLPDGTMTCRRLTFTQQSTQLKSLSDSLRLIMDEGASFYCWFSPKSTLGSPMLLIESSKPALKALAKSNEGDSSYAIGKISKAKWGIEFKLRKTIPSFLQHLSHFVAKHHGEYPVLRHLINARMTLWDAKGNLLEKHKNDKAWSTFLNPREKP